MRQRKSCSLEAANISADGIDDALYRRFISPGREVGVRVRAGAGADGHEQHLVFARLPAEAVRRERRHQEQLERGVVVHRDAAVDEDEQAAADLDRLRREVGGCGGAGANQLPERQVEVVVRPCRVVVLGVRVVRDRPRRVRGGVAHHEHQQRAQHRRSPASCRAPSCCFSRAASFSSSNLYRKRRSRPALSNIAGPAST